MDILKVGDPHQKVSSIAVTFVAACQVIEQAILQGANLIITHESVYYKHLGEIDRLRGDHVYEAKLRLLEEHQNFGRLR